MEGGGGAEPPARLAEACLRELVGRASFGHIRSVLRPVLTLDTHILTYSLLYCGGLTVGGPRQLLPAFISFIS